MEVDVLVIGQGLCGTWLSYYLEKNGLSYHVLDNGNPESSSRIASGLINPVTGRRLVKTWMIDVLMDHAKNAYSQFGNELGIPLIDEHTLINFPPSLQMKEAFASRAADTLPYLHEDVDEKGWTPYFHSTFGSYAIKPCLLVQTRALLDKWRQHLIKLGKYATQTFNQEEVILLKDQVRYGTLTARCIIFCDGTSSFNNKWFHRLPFAPSKGEALWIKVSGLPSSYIFKKGITLAPWENEVFWVGSSYEWEFIDPGPTPEFRTSCEQQLKEWLKIPYKVIDHRSSIRPANLERRPFVGLHPIHRQIGILNGMGTKGCSLAPYFAKQLAAHLKSGEQILPEAHVHRFARILAKP